MYFPFLSSPCSPPPPPTSPTYLVVGELDTSLFLKIAFSKSTIEGSPGGERAAEKVEDGIGDDGGVNTPPDDDMMSPWLSSADECI